LWRQTTRFFVQTQWLFHKVNRATIRPEKTERRFSGFGPIFEPRPTMEDLIVNRVASSSLIQIDMEDWFDERTRHAFDLEPFLFQGLVLKELDFRKSMQEYPWENFKGGIIAVYCSAEAIVPTWAYMLVAGYAAGVGAETYFCSPDALEDFLYDRKIQSLDLEPYKGGKVIVKGCSKKAVPLSAYVSLANRLQPVVQSLMFGEACSNVPLFKKKKI
jgi:hypothetical protein